VYAITLLLLCAAAPAETPLITGAGVGTIRSSQVIDSRALERAFPGCNVERHQRGQVSGSAIVHVWGLSCGATISSIGMNEIYIVAGDAKRRVVTVAVYGPGAKTREGIAVGSRVAELKKLGPLKCRLIPEEEMVGVGCVAVATPNVEFIFPAIPGTETSLRPLVHHPFAPDLDADRRIDIIEWTARSAAQ